VGDLRHLGEDVGRQQHGPAGTRWLRDLLRDFAAGGGAVLLSSHILAEVAQVAHDVVVITQGRVVGEGSLDALAAEYGGDLESYYLELTADTAGATGTTGATNSTEVR
jgi:ABC-2 type transport system ATP-binding protein